MKRDIEFRGLSGEGKFVYGYLSKDLKGSTCYYDEYPYRIHWHPESGGCANCPVKTETVGQYTGLKDKNGVKIFEGDLVLIRDSYNGKWSSGKAEVLFSYDYVGGWVASDGINDLTIGTRTEKIMVSGNIHEEAT